MNPLVTISSIQQRMAEGIPIGRVDEPTVRRLWWAALETLQEDILLPMNSSKGLWLASPLPALYEPKLLDRFQGWVWAPEELENFHSKQNGFLPPSGDRAVKETKPKVIESYRRLPLLAEDGHDPLLIIITPEIQVALALQGEPGQRNLLVRSDQEIFSVLLQMLDLRLKNEDPKEGEKLREALADLGPLRSNDLLQRSFWPFLSTRLAGMAPSLTIQALPNQSALGNVTAETSGEITLLEALTHEVRTPLATIRTLIRSILRRTDLPELVLNRLRQIDAECTEQIDRFGLIFNAVELQRDTPRDSMLASTNLGSMLEMLHPTWTEQLKRRGINLVIDITPDLPEVLSNPERLELMLGGLIDQSSRGLQPGEILSLELRPAGQRLKLQIQSKFSNSHKKEKSGIQPNADLGTVLSWNPSTGSLQLSLTATQRLLASLGGRLAHRRDSALTVFFPIAEPKY